MNGMDEWQRQENDRLRALPPTLRELFLKNLLEVPALDENGYICTKSLALKAFDDALATMRNHHNFPI